MTRLLTVSGVLGSALALVGTAMLATGGPGPIVQPDGVVPSFVAAPAPVRDTPAEQAAVRSRNPVPRASAPWVRTVAARTGISEPAVRAYADTSLRLSAEDPGCRLGWTTLAGIGQVETGHGQGVLDGDGRASGRIEGPVLDGTSGHASIEVGGAYDRARGPMQFIASTWRTWAADGDGDGQRDVDDIDDAALAAGRYLCHGGRDLTTSAGWSAAIFSYNHSDDYVRSVLAAADGYAARA